VVADLPANQRAHAVIFTYGYSQASALELLGTNLPPIYSGHNAYPYGVGLKSSRPDQLRRRPSIRQRAPMSPEPTLARGSRARCPRPARDEDRSCGQCGYWRDRTRFGRPTSRHATARLTLIA